VLGSVFDPRRCFGKSVLAPVWEKTAEFRRISLRRLISLPDAGFSGESPDAGAPSNPGGLIGKSVEDLDRIVRRRAGSQRESPE